jgi:hypothetical protein
LTLWNPTVHSVTSFVRVPVTSDYTIIDPMGQVIPADVSLYAVDRDENDLTIFSFFLFPRL